MRKLAIILIGAFLLLSSTGLASANLILNGDFEVNDSLEYWFVNNPNNVTTSTAPNGDTVAVFSVPDKDHPWANISQDFYVNPLWAGIMVEFDVHFETKEAVDSSFFKETVGLKSGGATAWAWQYKFEALTTTPASGWWYHATTTIPFDVFSIDDEDPNAKLLFSMKRDPNDWSWARLDNVEVNSIPGTNPVPEPSTVILLASGLLGLVGFSRKKLINSKSE